MYTESLRDVRFTSGDAGHLENLQLRILKTYPFHRQSTSESILRVARSLICRELASI